MNLFLISFQEPVSSAIKDRAKAAFSSSQVFILSDRLLLVRTSIENTKDLSAFFDLTGDGDDPISGVVFKLNGSYYGYYSSSLWDWLAKGRESSE